MGIVFATNGGVDEFRKKRAGRRLHWRRSFQNQRAQCSSLGNSEALFLKMHHLIHAFLIQKRKNSFPSQGVTSNWSWLLKTMNMPILTSFVPFVADSYEFIQNLYSKQCQNDRKVKFQSCGFWGWSQTNQYSQVLLDSYIDKDVLYLCVQYIINSIWNNSVIQFGNWKYPLVN